jgi:hypothetical protein
MVSFAVTPQLIEQALDMPEDCKIVGAEWDFASATVRLYLEGPGLPKVEPGFIVPSIMPKITVTIGDDGKRIHTWDWGK